MSKLIFSVPLIFLMSFIFISDVSAQAEIFGFGGYMTYSSVSVQEGTLSMNDGVNYGFGLDVGIRKGILVELSYTHNQTSARLKRFNGRTESLFDVNTHYFHIGAQYEFRRSANQKAVPYTLLTLGATLFDAKKASLTDVWRFSVAFGVGGKIYVSKKVGLRLQSRILMPLTFSSAGLWCGPGGCSVGVGSWASLIQFDFTVGIFIKLGR